MKNATPNPLFSLAILTAALSLLAACTVARQEVMELPNYDRLIGKKFSESVFMGRRIFKVIRDTAVLEELENRRSDGCILVFGVRKKDDVIEFWRIDSGVNTCKVTKNPINR